MRERGEGEERGEIARDRETQTGEMLLKNVGEEKRRFQRIRR